MEKLLSRKPKNLYKDVKKYFENGRIIVKNKTIVDEKEAVCHSFKTNPFLEEVLNF